MAREPHNADRGGPGAERGERSPIMAAWLAGDIPRALGIARAVPPGDPASPAARALVAGVAFDDNACTVEAALDAHERALAAPVADVDLRASLLRNTAHFL